MESILICDDEKDIVSALSIYLTHEGFTVYEAFNGNEALDTLKTKAVDLILLDIMMPQKNGYETLMEIRKKSEIPVIFITAKGEDTDTILGLNLGADDYITKPFNALEVVARVKSHLRRARIYRQSTVIVPDMYTFGPLSLDDRTKQIKVDGQLIKATPIEYAILKHFIQNPNTVFTPKQLYMTIWEDAPMGSEGTVAVHIRHLREKIEIDPSNPRLLKVVWGQGYILEGVQNDNETN